MRRALRVTGVVAAVAVAVLLVVAVGGVSLTRTSYGERQLTRLVQSLLARRINGTVYVGRISGGLHSEATIDSLEIRDRDDSLFFASGPVHVRYGLRDVLDRRILLSHARITRPFVNLRQHENGKWNWRLIFPDGPDQPRGAGRRFGDFIVMDSADVVDGRIVLSLPWRPDKTLTGERRDSAIREALSAFSRDAPGNDWPIEVRRTTEGFARYWKWRDVNASFSYLRIADPDSAGRLFVVARASGLGTDPPLAFSNIKGTARQLGDTITLAVSHFDLPRSRGSAAGRVMWGGDLPTRYDIAVRGDTVSLSDIAWVYPTLPVTGGGRLNVGIRNVEHPGIMDYAITGIDVRTTRSRVLGRMTFAVGGPELVVKDVELEGAPLDFDFIRALNGGPLAYDWQGQFRGTIRGPGGPLTGFRIDASQLTFYDANVPGAVSRGTARGVLDIEEPAFTKFHGLDVVAERLDLRTLQYLDPNFPHLRGVMAGSARLDSSWLDLRFSNADIVHRDANLPESRFTGGGRVTWGEKFLTYDLNLQALPLAMTTFAASYPDIPLRGNYSGPMRIRGRSDALEVATTLASDGGTVSFEGVVDSNLPVYGAKGHGTISGVNVRSLFANDKAPRTALNGNYTVDFRGDSVITGTGSIGAELNGTIERLSIASSMTRLRLDNGVAIFDTLVARSEGARVRGEGSVSLIEAREGDFRFDASIDSLAQFARFIAASTDVPTDSIRGALQLTGNVRGTSERMTLEGQLAGRSLGHGTRSVETLRGVLALAGLPKDARGSIALEADSIAAGAMRFRTASIRANVSGIGRAGFVASVASHGGVVTGLAGEAERRGDSTRIHVDSGAITVANGSRYRLEAPVRVDVLRSGVTVDSVLLRHSSTARLAVRNVRLVNDTIRGNVRTDSVDLGILEAFVPGVERARGALVANVDVGGSLQQPQLAGQFSITGGAASLPNVGLDLQTVNADIALERDTIHVRRLSAETPGDRRGRLAVDGYVSLERYRNPFFALRVRAHNFHAIDRPRFASLWVSSDSLTLRGPYRAAVVSGAIRVDRGTVYIPELVDKEIVDLTDPEFAGFVDTLLSSDRTVLPGTPAEFARNLSLSNVAVHIGESVWLRSAEANVQLGGSLNVTVGRDARTGERSQLALEGTLNAARGTYRLALVSPFVEPTFEVESGSLRFLGTPDLNPTLDIRAIHTLRQPRQRSSNVRDIRVRVNIRGTLERPQLTLDSPDNLPLTQSDLLSYLVTGEPAIGLAESDDTYRSQLASFALRYGGNLITSAIPRDIVDIVELQTVRLTDENPRATQDPYYYNLLNTRAVIGKQIGSQWFLGLSTGFCVVNRTNFVENFGLKLEYRFNSVYTAQAGIEPGSSDLACVRSTSAQLQQQTPRQFGFDVFRTWRF